MSRGDLIWYSLAKFNSTGAVFDCRVKETQIEKQKCRERERENT